MEKTIVLFLHEMAVATWIGGMIFLHFLSSEVEKLGPQYGVIMGKMTKTFSFLALLSILTLVVTGILLTYWHGGAARVQHDFILNLKHLAILLVIINGAILAIKIVPTFEKLAIQRSPKALVWQKRLKIHSTLNLILGIIIVFLAIL